MPKVELPFEALLEATEQLDARQIELLLQRASEIRRLQQQNEEGRLMAIWEQPPLSPKERDYLQDLINRLEEDQISEAERQELLRLDKQAVEAQVRRLQAVVDLAHLRGIEPAALLDQLQPRTQ